MEIKAYINGPEFAALDRVQVEADPGWHGYWAKQNGKVATVDSVEGHASFQFNDRGHVEKTDWNWVYKLQFDDGGVATYDRVNGCILRRVKPSTESDPDND